MGGISYSLALHLSLSRFSGWCDYGLVILRFLGPSCPWELHRLTEGSEASLQTDLGFNTTSAMNHEPGQGNSDLLIHL